MLCSVELNLNSVNWEVSLSQAHQCFVFMLQGEDQVALHSVGTAAIMVQVTGTNWPKPAYTLLATGLCRFSVDELLQETPYLVARVTQLDKLSREETGRT